MWKIGAFCCFFIFSSLLLHGLHLKLPFSPYHHGWVSTNRWGPLMGPGKAFDSNRFLIFCANVAGSPYGTISPVSKSPDTGEPYGPSFPPTSIRDDILWVQSHPLIHARDHPELTIISARYRRKSPQVCVGPSGRRLRCGCDRGFHGRDDRPRMASLHAPRFRPSHHPHRDLCTTLGVVYLVG